MFSITNKAIEILQKKLLERGTPNAYIRIGVKGSGGCFGFSYAIEYEDNPPRERDFQFNFDNLKILIDNKSIKFLENATIDWEESLISRGFKFDNSAVSKTCGCGNSFTIKE